MPESIIFFLFFNMHQLHHHFFFCFLSGRTPLMTNATISPVLVLAIARLPRARICAYERRVNRLLPSRECDNLRHLPAVRPDRNIIQLGKAWNRAKCVSIPKIVLTFPTPEVTLLAVSFDHTPCNSTEEFISFFRSPPVHGKRDLREKSVICPVAQCSYRPCHSIHVAILSVLLHRIRNAENHIF